MLRVIDIYSDDDDSDEWDSWNITFYGQVPKVGKESEGSIRLDFDVIINTLEWKFPLELTEGWVATVYANKSPILDLDLAKDPQGFIELERSCVLPSGGYISARIYYADETDLRPLSHSNKAHSLGYSLIVSGVQESSGLDPFTAIMSNTDDEEKARWKTWRQEMV